MRRTPRTPRPARSLMATVAVAALALGVTFASAAAGVPALALPSQPKTPMAQVPLAPLGHVEVRGTGPIAMVLIPGLACDWTVFDTFMTRNAQKYTMYAVTLPGFGGSLPPADPRTPPTADAWLINAELAVLKMIDERNLDRPIIVGHSMGAHLAYRLAARHPDKFRGAISIEGLTWVPLQDLSKGNVTTDVRKGMVEGQLGGRFRKRTDAEWKKQAAESTPQFSKNAESGERIAKMMSTVPAPVVNRYFLEHVAGDLTGEVAQIKIPTLAIIAISDQEDALRPKLAQRSMRLGQIADAPAITAVVFDDTRIMVMDDRPEDLDKVIDEFLTGKAVSDAAKQGPPLDAAAPPAATPDPGAGGK